MTRNPSLVPLRHLRPGVLGLVAMGLAACSDSSPTSGVCTVRSVTVQGLPAQITAGQSVDLDAVVDQSRCDAEELVVSWSASGPLQIDQDGTVQSEALGGPFTVTATVGGASGDAETVVGSLPAVADDRWSLAWMYNSGSDNWVVSQGGNYPYASSTGGDILATRTGPGAYSVTFAGLAAAEGQRQAVAVSAYGGDPRRCRVVSHGNQGSDLEVFVRCHDLSGTPADSRYDILVVPAGSTEGRSAFAVTPSPTGGNVLADASHNSEGGAINLERAGAGLYEVTLAGLARSAVPLSGEEVFHVTAFGSGEAWCKLGSWGPEGDDMVVIVRCLTPTGSAADARFSLLMLEKERPGGHRLGYVWADEPTAAAYYAPDQAYNYNSSGDVNDARENFEGRYSVLFNGLNRPIDEVAETNLVTAIGDDATYCQVRSWGGSAVTLECYAPTGVLASSELAAIWIE